MSNFSDFSRCGVDGMYTTVHISIYLIITIIGCGCLTFTALVAGTVLCLCNHQVNMHLRTTCTQQQQQQQQVQQQQHQEGALKQSIINTKQLFVPNNSTAQLWNGITGGKRSPGKRYQTLHQQPAAPAPASTPTPLPVEKGPVKELSDTDSSSSSANCLIVAGIIVIVQSPTADRPCKIGDVVKLPSKVSTNLSVYGKSNVDIFGHGNTILYFLCHNFYLTLTKLIIEMTVTDWRPLVGLLLTENTYLEDRSDESTLFFKYIGVTDSSAPIQVDEGLTSIYIIDMIERLISDDDAGIPPSSISFKFIDRLGGDNGDISKGLITNIGKGVNEPLRVNLSLLRKLSEVKYNQPPIVKRSGPAAITKPNFLQQYTTSNTLIVKLLTPVVPFVTLKHGKSIPAALAVSTAEALSESDEELSVFSNSTDTKSKKDRSDLSKRKNEEADLVDENESEEAKTDDRVSSLLPSGIATSKRATSSKSTKSSSQLVVGSQSSSVDSRRSKRQLRQNQFISCDDYELSNVNSYNCALCGKVVGVRVLTCCSTYVCFDCYEQYTCTIHVGAK